MLGFFAMAKRSESLSHSSFSQRFVAESDTAVCMSGAEAKISPLSSFGRFSRAAMVSGIAMANLILATFQSIAGPGCRVTKDYGYLFGVG